MSGKIVHVITRLEFGGAQQNTLYTLEHLEKGFSGILVCGRGSFLDSRALGSDRYVTRFCPFLVRRIDPVYDLAAAVWLFFYFMSLKPDIVHTHSSKAGILARWAARLSGVKNIIHTFHGFGFNPLQNAFVRSFFIFLERVTAHVTDVLVAVAHANVDKALRLSIGRPKQYEVIRSGIDFERFEKKTKYVNIRRLLGLKETDIIIGNISCFKPQKGLLDFIEACGIIARRNRNVYFVLIGDGCLRRELKKTARKNGLNGRLFMMGWRQDVEDIIPGFDIMLHTAYFEGLARVLLEAMVCSKPVVATAVDGALDVIDNGKNGFLAEPGDVEALAKYAERLVRDENLRAGMGRESRKKLKPEFRIDVMSGQLNRLYSKLAGRINE